MWKIKPIPKCWLSFWKIWCGFYQEIILSSGVFRRETASGFYPWGNVVSPRKRVAEGLCGWRHGNSFPMTQSAQSLRQMRSIPHCSKAVFYVFVFDSIHNSATLHNLSPGIFHWTTKIQQIQQKNSCWFVVKTNEHELHYIFCWICWICVSPAPSER